jgi:hypothetical protein
MVMNFAFCIDKRKKWANSQYVESFVDWSKVAVDTPIVNTDHINREKKLRGEKNEERS